jgi:small subunit ribosomal protein S3
MGHKVSPLAFRIGYIKTWKSTGYYNKKDYGKKVASDVALRIFIQKFLTGIPVGNIFINHATSETTISIYTAKTALILGKNDENKERLERDIAVRFPGKFIIEVKSKKPELPQRS